MRVRDVMTAEVLAVRKATSARAAFETMASAAVRHLPVMDDDGRLCGIISDRDVRDNAVMLEKRSRLSPDSMVISDALLAADIMTARPVTIGPDAPVREAAALMLARRVSALPVVEDGILIGVITEVDMLRLLMSLL